MNDDDRDDYRRGPGPTTTPKPANPQPTPKPEPLPQHLTPTAIAACPDCDQHGYRNQVICDHQDHTTAAERGMAHIRAQMGWKPPAGTRTPKPAESPSASQPGR